MIFTKFIGGLGNQMFIYAFGYMLEKKYGIEVVFDESFYDNRPGHEHKFHMFNYGSIDNKCFMSYKPKTKVGRVIHHFLHDVKKKIIVNEVIKQKDSIEFIDITPHKTNVMYEGYWQNPRYFDEYRYEIVSQLQLRSVSNDLRKAIDLIKDNNYCAIHIRRGDYSTFYGNSILPIQYYTIAIERMKRKIPNVKFLLFSDDIEACKEYFTEQSIFFISDLGRFSDEEELEIMRNCDSFIIANSSFSWWAAYLSLSPNVICPLYKRWNSEFYHHSWETIDVNTLL